MSKTSAAASRAAAAAASAAYKPAALPTDDLLAEAEVDAATPSCVFGAVNSIIAQSIERLYALRIERIAEAYVAQAAVRDLLAVIEWRTMEVDLGEGHYLASDASAVQGAELHNWKAEAEPPSCPLDRWARHVIPRTGRPISPPPSTAALMSTGPFPVQSSDPIAASSSLSSSRVRPSSPFRPTVSNSKTPRHSTPSGSAARAVSPLTATAFSLPSQSPSTVSEQQRLALLATFRSQQTARLERERHLRAAQEEDQRRQDEERARERAVLSSRRMKAEERRELRAAVAAAARPLPPPLPKKAALPPPSPRRVVTSIALAAPAPAPAAPRTSLLVTSSITKRPRKPKQPPPDPSPVSTYTGSAGLLQSMMRAIQPAPGVKVVWGSEVKVGGELGGGNASSLRGMRVEDDEWKAAVQRMTRSQYLHWLSDQHEDVHRQQQQQQQEEEEEALVAAPSSTSPAATSCTRPPAVRVEEQKEQLSTARLSISVAPKRLQVDGRERRDLSFDSRIATDDKWPGVKGSGSNSEEAKEAIRPVRLAEAHKGIRHTVVRRGRWGDRSTEDDGIERDKAPPVKRGKQHREHGQVQVLNAGGVAALFEHPAER